MNRFQIWYEANKEKRKAKMRLYYYQNKKNWDTYRARFKKKRKTKRQKRFREARAKCIQYLIRTKNYSYREVCDRLSFDDPKNVWKILNNYERKLNEKAKQEN